MISPSYGFGLAAGISSLALGFPHFYSQWDWGQEKRCQGFDPLLCRGLNPLQAFTHEVQITTLYHPLRPKGKLLSFTIFYHLFSPQKKITIDYNINI
jgi:hypothetical protein